ncbi:unnamed protein product, partial [Amoebophrya sp. A25]
SRLLWVDLSFLHTCVLRPSNGPRLAIISLHTSALAARCVRVSRSIKTPSPFRMLLRVA